MKTHLEQCSHKLKNAWCYQKQRMQGGILPKGLWRECGPADTLTLDFWPPEL